MESWTALSIGVDCRTEVASAVTVDALFATAPVRVSAPTEQLDS
jgi:hypothetical protein